MFSLFRPVIGLKPEIHQRVECCITNQVNAAANTAVAAVRTTPLNVFLATERQAAITAFPGFYLYAGFIYKFHDCLVS